MERNYVRPNLAAFNTLAGIIPQELPSPPDSSALDSAAGLSTRLGLPVFNTKKARISVDLPLEEDVESLKSVTSEIALIRATQKESKYTKPINDGITKDYRIHAVKRLKHQGVDQTAVNRIKRTVLSCMKKPTAVRQTLSKYGRTLKWEKGTKDFMG